jgi:methenyltetrahydromethanopterin cyclohydrolase
LPAASSHEPRGAVLVAALSGRALASAARRGGYTPLVADLFGDVDTRQLAAAVEVVAGDFDTGFDPPALVAALRRLAAGRAVAGLVCGAGFEAAPDILDRLAQDWPLLGNHASAVRRLKDPVAFAAMCRELGIAHPEVRVLAPADPRGWLAKRAGASGGGHVVPAEAAPGAAPGRYWQRRVEGRPVSAAILADGKRAHVVAFTQQWAEPSPAEPLRYGGAVRPADLSTATGERLREIAIHVAEAVGLVGLNSADYILGGDDPALLEINPRPGASLDVLADDDGLLFHAHVEACRGRLPDRPMRFSGAHAAAVVWAPRAIVSVPALDWPAWAADRQPAGSAVAEGAPFCTVLARAPDAQAAREAVNRRVTIMLDRATRTRGRPPSVNALAAPLVEAMVRDADALRIAVSTGSRGERLIDCGSQAVGGIEAGVRMAQVCLGGLGVVSVTPDATFASWPFSVAVRSSQPVIACLGSQYAGWKLQSGTFFALGSGPARALAAREELYAEIGYRDEAETAALVIEAEGPPPADIVDEVADACRVRPAGLTILYAPTRSLAGSVQVVARSLEVAMHKAHTVHFPLHRIVDGAATAPLAPPHPDFLEALGRTNDAIIYGGRVWLFVEGSAGEARALAERLPSSTSRDYGEPFAAIFRRFNGDFYAIDPLLFSPAEAVVTAIEHGGGYRCGSVDLAKLHVSFG